MSLPRTVALPVVSTPLQEYAHPERENHVTLVGMIHVAQSDYYRDVQRVIAEREASGATVHYEGVRPPTFAEASSTPKALLKRAERIKEALSALYDGLEGTGLTKQSDMLQIGEDWENHDANLVELADHMGGLTVRRFNLAVTLANKMIVRMNPESKRRFIKGFATSLNKGMSTGRSRGWLQTALIGNTDASVVDYRNEIALSALDQHADAHTESDLVLVWGAFHLPGLGSGLVDRGYEKIGEHRIRAIDTSQLVAAFPSGFSRLGAE